MNRNVIIGLVTALILESSIIAVQSQVNHDPSDISSKMPDISAQLKSGETIAIAKQCGRVTSVTVTDEKGRTVFSLVEPSPAGRDCER